MQKSQIVFGRQRDHASLLRPRRLGDWSGLSSSRINTSPTRAQPQIQRLHFGRAVCIVKAFPDQVAKFARRVFDTGTAGIDVPSDTGAVRLLSLCYNTNTKGEYERDTQHSASSFAIGRNMSIGETCWIDRSNPLAWSRVIGRCLSSGIPI